MTTERPFVEHLKLAGFKSIRQAEIDFTKLNVLIGSNGAGKSNLVSSFAMLHASLNNKLDEYVGRNGGPNALFHLGTKFTSEIITSINVHTPIGRGMLHQRLGFRPPDGLYPIIDHDAIRESFDQPDLKIATFMNAYFSMFKLGEPDPLGSQLFHWIYLSLRDRLATYHLVDTSLTSAIRTEGYIQDNQRLNPDGGNLAAILYLYKSKHPTVYNRIRSTVRKIAPSFDDFVLEPQRFNANNILLNWRQAGSDYLLGPHQISDGTLRAMALCTLLLQPTEDLPDLLILDEPELGLHPLAITIIAGLIRAASVHVQVIVTTQSIEFLDHFEAGEVIVVDSAEGASQFRRLDPSSLKDWLEEYSVGELWRKNVIGGGPMP
jgi:predicted ATPase